MNTEQQRQAARHQILQRLHEYCWGYDSNDMPLLGSVFTEDASSGGFVAGAEVAWGPWSGKASIVEALSAIRNSQPDRRRHVVDSYLFDERDEQRAEVRLYVSIFSYANGQPPHLVTTGEYSFTAVNSGDRWRLSRLDEVLDSAF